MSVTEDADSLLSLLQRTTEENWLQPLLDDPDSGAIVRAQIAIMARLGATIIHNTDAATISGASGGQAGTCTLTVSRAAGGTTGTIPRGYPFIDPRGVKLFLTLDVVIGSGALTASLPLQTIRQTELLNTEDDPGLAVDPTAPIVPASAGVLIAPAGSVGMTTTTFQTIGPATQITGAAADWLSVHGRARGLPRQPGETEADYRQRIRNIPDAVAPIAIGDIVQGVVQRLGLPPMLVLEPFADGATPALKALHGLSSFAAPAFDVDFFDDPLSGLVLEDRRTATAYFSIEAQDFVRDTDGFGVCWDATYGDDPVLGFPDDLFNVPPSLVGPLLSLVTDVAVRKGGGVNFDVILKMDDPHVSVGATAAGVFTSVWTMTPTVGTIWLVDFVAAGHTSPNPDPLIAHRLVFDLEDGSTLTSADFASTWTEVIAPPTQRVTAVHGFLRSNGGATSTLAGYVRALEMTL